MNLNQITLKVSDLPRSIAFYETLGLTLIVNSGNPYARMECPANGSPEGGTTLSFSEVDHVTPGETGLYFEVPNVGEAVQSLQQKGITFETEPREQSWLWHEAWLKDPDGHRLCIYHAGKNRRYPPWRIIP